ncbi:MAG: carboxypeptidase regulatory-like domain-containing protein [Deltaproteobacteria bacterium]|nr:carboxypeptidase regulatory-like domain-containing protein [Deltaproteobacteria bacterium]
MSRSILASTLPLLLAFGCSSSDDDNNNNGGTPSGVPGVVNGRVLDAWGSRIGDARVLAAGRSTMTNESGFFVLPELPAGRQSLFVEADGYAQGGQAVTVVSGRTTYVEIRVLAFDAESTFEASAGGAVQASGAVVTFPPGAFAASGEVTARIAVLDASDRNELATFPGDFTTDDGALLESFGAIAVEVTDSAGNQLNLAQPAALTLPVSASAADAIPLWSFDEDAGVWVREGELTGCVDGSCDASLPHLSWWNADQVLETTCLEVCVEDGDGTLSAGVALQARGIDYGGVSYAATGEDGCACLEVKRGGRVGVVGFSSALVTEPVEVTAPDTAGSCGDASCLRLDAPLVVATPKFQATLEWGEAPSDLDAQFTGPCDPDAAYCEDRFHVYYSDQGSLAAAPWAYLDTDDTSSYGPEVVTLARCFPGTYRYAVHNFSESPDIITSEARVTVLTPDGRTQVFSVPSANPAAGDVWIVGDLICQTGSGCNCTWQTVDAIGTLEDIDP